MEPDDFLEPDRTDIVGDQAAYGRYRENVFQKKLADEQQMTAQIYQMDWGPWGPGWYY